MVVEDFSEKKCHEALRIGDWLVISQVNLEIKKGFSCITVSVFNEITVQREAGHQVNQINHTVVLKQKTSITFFCHFSWPKLAGFVKGYFSLFNFHYKLVFKK